MSYILIVNTIVFLLICNCSFCEDLSDQDKPVSVLSVDDCWNQIEAINQMEKPASMTWPEFNSQRATQVANLCQAGLKLSSLSNGAKASLLRHNIFAWLEIAGQKDTGYFDRIHQYLPELTRLGYPLMKIECENQYWMIYLAYEADRAKDNKHFLELIQTMEIETGADTSRTLYNQLVLYSKAARAAQFLPDNNQTAKVLYTKYIQKWESALQAGATRDENSEQIMSFMRGSLRRLELPGTPLTFKGLVYNPQQNHQNLFNLNDLKGKVILVFLWRTDLPYIVDMMKDIHQMYDQFHNKGLEIAGISLDQVPADFNVFINHHRYPWLHFHNSNTSVSEKRSLAEYYSIQTIPTFFVIDRNFNVIMVSDSFDQMKQTVEDQFK